MDSVVMRADRLVVVVAPDHQWARRTEPVGPEELARTDLIVRERGSGTRGVLDDALALWGGVRPRLELGSPSAIVTAARCNQGPAVLSELVVADDLADGRLVMVATEGLNLERLLRAMWRSDRPLPPLARSLLTAAAGQATEGVIPT